MSVDDGEVEVVEANRDADCVIKASEEDFLRIIQGDLNLITGLLQGRIEVDGEMWMAQVFNGIVRSQLRQPAGASPRACLAEARVRGPATCNMSSGRHRPRVASPDIS